MLAVADLRRRITTALEDSDLQGLLNAAYQAIDGRVPSGPQTELLRVDAGDLVVLSYPARSITSIRDRGVDLDPDDWAQLSPTLLRRLATGPHPARHWHRPEIAYLMTADEAERDRIAIALIQLDLTYKPGLTGQRLGEWSESYSQATGSYPAEREAILSSYAPSGGAFV